MPLQEKYPSFFGRQPKISVFPALTKANFFLKLKKCTTFWKIPPEIQSLPLRNNCFNPTQSYCPLICYWHRTLFFQLILHVDLVLCNCSNSRIWLFVHNTLTFFSVLSPSHFISALWQSCVLSSVVLINEYEWIPDRQTDRQTDRQQQCTYHITCLLACGGNVTQRSNSRVSTSRERTASVVPCSSSAVISWWRTCGWVGRSEGWRWLERGQTSASPPRLRTAAAAGPSNTDRQWLACWTRAQKGPGSNCSRDAVS